MTDKLSRVTARTFVADVLEDRLPRVAMTEKRKLPEPRMITIPDQDYQPPKEEREKEHDILGASIERVQSAFFRPFHVRR